MTKTRDLADLGGGFIQAGTGAVQRTVESKLQDVVSVKDFGAVGDGVTDDTNKIQLAFNSAAAAGVICYLPRGTYMVSSLEMPSGLFIQGAGKDETIFKQIADSTGAVLKSSYGTGIRMITLRDFYVDGNRATFTDPTKYNDGIYFEGGAAASNYSCIAQNVWVQRATGNGWHFGPNRNAPNLRYCYGYNCGNTLVASDPVGNSTGYGLRVNSCSDAYIGTGSGFGSNKNGSVLISTSATPVVESTEIWWASQDPGKPNIEFYQCPNFICSKNNLDGSRFACVKVTGRYTVDTQPFHENSFIINNTFKTPLGANGAGVDGDVDFIQLQSTSGVLIAGNEFESNGAADPSLVLAKYIVNALNANVYDIAFLGNHWSTRTNGEPFLTGICNNYTIFSRFEASGTFTPLLKDASGNTATAAVSNGKWLADGNTITYDLTLQDITTTGLTAGDGIRIYGLLASNPLPSTFSTAGSVQFQQINVVTPAMGYVATSAGATDYIQIRGLVDNGNRSTIIVSELNSGTADIWLQITLPLHNPKV